MKQVVAGKPDVLVVDDDQCVLDSLSTVLEDQGYVVRTARDGIDALEAIKQRRPDLVITDLMMPNMSGWELLSALHEDAELSSIPTLIITAAREALPERPSPVLSKPFDLDSLLAAIALQTPPPANPN